MKVRKLRLSSTKFSERLNRNYLETRKYIQHCWRKSRSTTQAKVFERRECERDTEWRRTMCWYHVWFCLHRWGSRLSFCIKISFLQWFNAIFKWTTNSQLLISKISHCNSPRLFTKPDDVCYLLVASSVNCLANGIQKLRHFTCNSRRLEHSGKFELVKNFSSINN